MSARRPSARAAAARVEGVEAELALERAATLRRAGDRLADALAALRAADPGEREPRVVDAADALWRYVVTREACGLRDAETVMQGLDVPPEVRRRMGPAPPCLAR